MLRSAAAALAASLAYVVLVASSVQAATESNHPAARAERARDLGIELDGTPGPFNAITDVAGVEVGHVTLIRGEGALKRGEGPVRTGVTAILPRGKTSIAPVFAAWETGNAAGEMTGTVWLEERGLLEGPVMITNTHSVGVVRDAVVEWLVDHEWDSSWFTPLVAETYDGALNDVNGHHVKREPRTAGVAGGSRRGRRGRQRGRRHRHDLLAIQGRHRHFLARRTEPDGALRRRCAGAMQLWSPRAVARRWRARGARAQGPIHALHRDVARYLESLGGRSLAGPCRRRAARGGREGSIIVVLATDAPLLPHQLKRLAKRPAMAMGRLGDIGGEGSGDIFVAFSTANAGLQSQQDEVIGIQAFPNPKLTSLFEAAVQATEEAILNAMLAAQTMTGRDGFRVHALPHAQLKAILAKYRRAAD